MSSEPTWKKQGFKSRSDYEEHLSKQRGFKSTHEYQEHLAKQKMCKSLQKLTSNMKDTESLFSDIEFIRKITGCKIPTKNKIIKQEEY